MKNLKNLFLLSILLLSTQAAYAASSAMPLADVDIPNDEASIQRGFEVYYNVCRMCHELKYIKYQYLSDIGFDKARIDALRGSKMLNESIKGTMSDEATISVFGAVPPDISLMAKARKHGPEYLYTLLTAYYEKTEGSYDNKLFEGIKMPDPFGYSVATAEAKATIETQVKDVVAFLTWASDPQADERATMGIYVIGYLLILTLLFYLIMKRVWSRLPPPVSESL